MRACSSFQAPTSLPSEVFAAQFSHRTKDNVFCRTYWCVVKSTLVSKCFTTVRGHTLYVVTASPNWLSHVVIIMTAEWLIFIVIINVTFRSQTRWHLTQNALITTHVTIHRIQYVCLHKSNYLRIDSTHHYAKWQLNVGRLTKNSFVIVRSPAATLEQCQHFDVRLIVNDCYCAVGDWVGNYPLRSRPFATSKWRTLGRE